MAQYLLTPPTVEEGPVAWKNLLNRYRLTRGISIIQRLDLTFYTARYPSQQELSEALQYWLGGHEYILDQATRDALVAGGFAAYITDYFPPGSYGSLAYGAGPYGG